MPITPERVGEKADAIFYTRNSEAPVVDIRALDEVRLDAPIQTKILLPGPKGSVLEYHIKESQRIPPHRFAHDSIYYMVEGRANVRLAGESYDAEQRDAWSASPGVEIELEAIDDCVILEWMGPPHVQWNDRLITWGPVQPATSHLFARWKDIPYTVLQRVEGETVFGPEGVDIEHHLKVLIPGPNGSLIWNTHREKKWALHTHYHHWLTYLVHGKMRTKFGGTEVFVANDRDCWAAQGGAEHSSEALADNEVVEFKWPAPFYLNGVIHSWERR